MVEVAKTLKCSKSDGWRSLKRLKNAKSDGWNYRKHRTTQNLMVEVA